MKNFKVTAQDPTNNNANFVRLFKGTLDSVTAEVNLLFGTENVLSIDETDDARQIYLRDRFYNYHLFEYLDLVEVTSKLVEFSIGIGDRTKIGNRTKIGYGTNIGDDTKIGDDTNIGNRTNIGDGTKIGDRTNIGDDTNIGNRTKIGNGIMLGIRSTVGSNITLLTGFYLKGSSHPVTYCGNNMLSIGCRNYSIEDWKNVYARIGASESYSDEQVKEYYAYILLAEQFTKIVTL